MEKNSGLGWHLNHFTERHGFTLKEQLYKVIVTKLLHTSRSVRGCWCVYAHTHIQKLKCSIPVCIHMASWQKYRQIPVSCPLDKRVYKRVEVLWHFVRFFIYNLHLPNTKYLSHLPSRPFYTTSYVDLTVIIPSCA